MGQTKHTPGPWHFDCGVFYSCDQMDNEGMTSEMPIAEMGGGRDCDYEANARLIAAAPELLEALKELHDWLVAPSGSVLPSFDKARSAIAKATGGDA